MVKGVLRPDDAEIAVQHGVSAIAVSNHGGRQLDGVQATVFVKPHLIRRSCYITLHGGIFSFFFFFQIDALPAIVKQVNGRCEIFLDGGVTKGTDVLKALALGAKMVYL